MSADFLTRLKTIQTQIENVLDEVLPKPEGYQAVVSEAMRYATLDGGKRLRPFLMVETAGLFGDVSHDVWKAAASLECLHVFSLIHDDLPCMDDDDLRRGKPTVHVKYDEAIAVLAGDGLSIVAFDVLARLDVPAELRLELIQDLSVAAGDKGMIGGQIIDLIIDEDDRDETLIT